MISFSATMSSTRIGWYSLPCFLLFAVVSALVVSGATMTWDIAILRAVADLRQPGLTTVMRALSEVGNWPWEVPLAAGIAIVLRLRSRAGDAWRFLALGLSAEALFAVTKLLFHRPRPSIIPHLGQAGWYSYPSGHTMLALILWGFGLTLVAELFTAGSAKVAWWTLAVALPCGIAASRIYLGVHYPSDVVGALCLGGGWLLLWRDPVFWPRRSATSSAPATK